MKYFKIVFSKKMYQITLIFLVLYILVFLPTGINKTIPWNWIGEFAILVKLYFGIILLIYFLGYGLISLLKRNTSVNISIIHSVVIFFSLLLSNTNFNDIIVIINLISFILYIINIFFSIYLINEKIEITK